MIRIKDGNLQIKKRKKYLKLTKGYRGNASKLTKFASEQITQSLATAYIGRKLKKRTFHFFWIYRINAALRIRGYKYSNFLGNLRKLNILLNRKMLALLSYMDLSIFNTLIRIIQNSLI